MVGTLRAASANKTLTRFIGRSTLRPYKEPNASNLNTLWLWLSEGQYIKPIWAARGNPLVAQMFFAMPLGCGFVSTAQCPAEEHEKCPRDIKGRSSRGPSRKNRELSPCSSGRPI